MSPFVDDGYVCFKVIAENPGIHGAHDFTYRPSLSKARTELQIASNSGIVKKQEETEAAIVVEHTISLSNAPTITIPLALKLKPALRQAMLNLILGYVGSDEERADVKN